MAPRPDTATLQDSASSHTGDILWCRDLSEDAFLFALGNAPYFLYETARNTPPSTADVSFACPPSPDALFLLATPTCYRAPVAEWLSRALASHYCFPQALTLRIRTALHEAIANAVIHGSLGIHGRFQDIKGFDAYCADIRARLRHPKYRLTRISIAIIRRPGTLTLCVGDEGDGYEDDTGFSQRLRTFPPGQGLSIIREQCCAARVASGGSTIEMDFVV